MGDKIQFVPQGQKPETPISHDPLFSQWINMHKDSFKRDTKDSSDSMDAYRQDVLSSIGRKTGKTTAAQKRADDLQDLQGDRQAIGDKHHPGADQRNANADSKIVALDQALLKKYGDKLSPEMRQTLQEDIAAKTKTAANSTEDIGRERQYIKSDNRELAALAHGSKAQIRAADREQIGQRDKDAQREVGYVQDNDRSQAVDKKILSQFGGIQIVHSPEVAYLYI